MRRLPANVVLLIVAGEWAVANIDATFLLDAVRLLGGLPMAAGLTNVTALARSLAGPVFATALRLQGVLVLRIVHAVATDGAAMLRDFVARRLSGPLARVAYIFNAVAAAASIAWLMRFFKSVGGVS